jgi:SMODS and SLOG-associating 2TM effector domain family 5
MNDAAGVSESGYLAAEKADLVWRIKVTAGSRFIAAERLRRREKRVSVLNAVASAAVIFLSIVSATIHTAPIIGAGLLLVTIFASLLILVTALIQFASNDAVNAERMHQCALALGALRRTLMYAEFQRRSELLAFANEYDSILARYPNHESADYQRYRNKHPTEFADYPQRGKGPGGVGSAFVTSLLPLIASIITIVLTIIAVGLALWGHWLG